MGFLVVAGIEDEATTREVVVDDAIAVTCPTVLWLVIDCSDFVELSAEETLGRGDAEGEMVVTLFPVVIIVDAMDFAKLVDAV